MWNSSEIPSNSIPHQTPSLNHSLLCAFAAVGPCVHLTSGLKERGRPKATPARRTITPKTINICIPSLYLWVTPTITYCIQLFSISRRTRESRDWTTGAPSLATFVDYEPTTILADTRTLALEPEARQVGLRYLGDSVAGGPRIVRVGDADESAADPKVRGGRDQRPRPLVAPAPVLVQGRDPVAVDLPGRRVHGGEAA